MSRQIIILSYVLFYAFWGFSQKSINIGVGYPHILKDGIIDADSWMGVIEFSASYSIYSNNRITASIFFDSPVYIDNPREDFNFNLLRNDIHVGISGSYRISEFILESILGWTFTTYKQKGEQINRTDFDNGFLIYPRIKYVFKNDNKVFFGYRHTRYLGVFKPFNPENTITGGYIFSFNITKRENSQ